MVAVAVGREVACAVVADVRALALVGGEQTGHGAVALLDNGGVRCELVYLRGVLNVLHDFLPDACDCLPAVGTAYLAAVVVAYPETTDVIRRKSHEEEVGAGVGGTGLTDDFDILHLSQTAGAAVAVDNLVYHSVSHPRSVAVYRLSAIEILLEYHVALAVLDLAVEHRAVIHAAVAEYLISARNFHQLCTVGQRTQREGRQRDILVNQRGEAKHLRQLSVHRLCGVHSADPDSQRVQRVLHAVPCRAQGSVADNAAVVLGPVFRLVVGADVYLRVRNERGISYQVLLNCQRIR